MAGRHKAPIPSSKHQEEREVAAIDLNRHGPRPRDGRVQPVGSALERQSENVDGQWRQEFFRIADLQNRLAEVRG